MMEKKGSDTENMKKINDLYHAYEISIVLVSRQDKYNA